MWCESMWLLSLLLLLLIASNIDNMVVVVVNAQEEDFLSYAFCGDCWCIPEINDSDMSSSSCPIDEIPATEFDSIHRANLKALVLENPMTLNCNPYEAQTDIISGTCDTVPPLVINENDDDTSTVCAAIISGPMDDEGNQQCPESYTYRLETFQSAEEAESFRNSTTTTSTTTTTTSLMITHEGSCGVCSSFQDLAVYMEVPDLANAGTNCAIRALTGNVTDGIQCYRDIGFTESCAAMWLYNTQYTSDNCLTFCLAHTASGLPNNSPAPACELVDCIQCDEDIAGPLFMQFAGRTRRRSGLLSKIVRPCRAIPRILHEDPCPSMVGSSGGSSSRRNEVNKRNGLFWMLSATLMVYMYGV